MKIFDFVYKSKSLYLIIYYIKSKTEKKIARFES